MNDEGYIEIQILFVKFRAYNLFVPFSWTSANWKLQKFYTKRLINVKIKNKTTVINNEDIYTYIIHYLRNSNML
jgi:hypothetical protein